MFRSKKERDYWVQIIEETKKRWIETDRRLQERQRKVSVIQPNQLDDKTPTDPNTNFLSSKNQANGDSSEFFSLLEWPQQKSGV